jgi:hypothetical protein
MSIGPEPHSLEYTVGLEIHGAAIDLAVLLGATEPFGQGFGKRPELPDRHFEVGANRKHDVTCDICLATLY